MSEPSSGPLSDQRYADIQSQLKDLNDLRAEIVRAQHAGIDMTGRMEHCDDLCQKLEAIKRQYFPQRP